MEKKSTCQALLKLNCYDKTENCFVYGECYKTLWVSYKITFDLGSYYMNKKQIKHFMYVKCLCNSIFS